MTGTNLTGKLALVTGASRGLGRAMAIALAGAGAPIALVGRDGSKLSETAELIRSEGGSAETYQADVTKEQDVRRLEQEVAAKQGRIAILINNAGVNCRKSITDFTLDEW